MSKQVTTTAKSGLIADNQYGKIYGSSPAGPGGTTQSIVSGILYNGYGQISKLSYGNGTYTDYDYNVSGSGASAPEREVLEPFLVFP